MLNQIQIILVEPSHPGNIGAVARAMKTMGLERLVLVNPKKYPHYEASKRAAGADDVLDQAKVVGSLDEAIADCHIVLGTSVREREVSWPLLDPKQNAESLFKEELKAKKVAILFGRENSGLSNEEMDCCQYQIQIPANDEYSSLNLASAVQIIAYEIRMCFLSKQQAECELDAKSAIEQRQTLASIEQRAGYLQHLQKVLTDLDFIKSNPPTKLMRKLTRLYHKAQLTIEEIQILRGILTATEMKISKLKKSD